ncbi:MAG: sterol desaturase family protein [Verrucomicrobiales bacterium]|nr:sterol desaturase family protein [Verrucomicrobiales bacterium]MCP5558096.1 sterol desaturase family protein [Verrucomicrobiaceae bacterium]
MSPSLKGTLIGFVVLSILFLVVERLFGNAGGKRWFRRQWILDASYWIFTPFVTKALTRLTLLMPLGLIVLLGVATKESLVEKTFDGFGPLSLQPLWLQAVEILVLGDLVAYWTHRLFHGRRWWPFHAVHHSSEQLDWLSSVRVHPVNDLVNKLAQVTPLLLLGFNPFATLASAPFLTLYAIFLHADVDWDFGPLRKVIATPAFHRWHHSKDAEAMDKNFAGLFPFWDILFGTLYMPVDIAPRNFGIHEAMSPTLTGQLLHPFRRKSSTAGKNLANDPVPAARTCSHESPV